MSSVKQKGNFGINFYFAQRLRNISILTKLVGLSPKKFMDSSNVKLFTGTEYRSGMHRIIYDHLINISLNYMIY